MGARKLAVEDAHITLRFKRKLLRAAKAKAAAEGKTLNGKVREQVELYVGPVVQGPTLDELMRRAAKDKPLRGKWKAHYTKDELHDDAP